jgi:N-acetylmuramoyl-L-alanine amidase
MQRPDARTPRLRPSPARRPRPMTPLPWAVAGSLTATVCTVTLGAHPAAAADYTVQSGDTVSGIAQRHGVRTADVLAANGLDWSSIIHPGQTLHVGGEAPPAAPAPAPAEPAAVGYTIVAGDTVTAIARAHGVSLDAVLQTNGLERSSIIYPGQTLVIPSSAPAAPAPAPEMQPAAATSPATVPLDADQIAHVQIIVRVGRELGVSDRGIAIALGTAMQESWIRNLDWGDRDSLGLFQQRPSTGWGTPEQILDPVRSTRVFFGGAGDPNGTLTRGLLDIPGWESMSFADAAQAVQISAYPDRYAQWEQPAYAWLATYG